MVIRGQRARTGGRRPSWRWGVSAIALLCLLGQTSALAHRVLVQHVTCAEHGESIHVSPASAAAVPARGVEPPAFAATVVEEAERHEHCAAADTRGATPRLVPDETAGPVPAGALVPPARASGVGPAVAAYVIAPKTSPPRTAS